MTYHESWEHRDWPHPGYVCKGCDSDVTYERALAHRCDPQTSGTSEPTARRLLGADQQQSGEAPRASSVASDGRTLPSSPVDPVSHWPGKGGELTPRGLPERRTASGEDDGTGTDGLACPPSVPVSVTDLVLKVREAFPTRLPVRGSAGPWGEASR